MPLQLWLRETRRSRLQLFSTAVSESFVRDFAPRHFAFLLKECQSPSSIRQIHQQILARGLLSSSPSPQSPSSSSSLVSLPSSLGTSIVASYLACGAPVDALSVLERLSPSPVLWWNLLIRQDITDGRLDHSLSLLRRMQLVGTRPDHFTLPFALKACGELPSYRRGSSLHGMVCTNGFKSNVFVCNSLLAMYARCGALDEARRVFNEIVVGGIDDLISWNSMVAAFVKGGNPRLALELFADMASKIPNKAFENRRSDVISLVNILPACASLRAYTQAKEIHGYAIRNLLFSDIFVGNAIIDVYAKCGVMEGACKVFNTMEVKDVVSWNAMVTGYSQNGNFDDALELFEKMREDNIALNVVTWSAMIAGYAQRGHGREALGVFRQMQLSGSEPNAVTIISLLSACASVGTLIQGMETHAYSLRKYMMTWDDDARDGEDLMVQNALIDMYSKCRRFSMARSLFDTISRNDRNVVTWTVMIGGYAQHGDANAALALFSQMISRPSAVSPNAFTISCILMACARLSALRFGKQIHGYVIRQRYEPAMLFVANCLIDMYAKCADIESARNVFDNMPQRNAVSWTSLMTGYGMHGCGNDALSVFDAMQRAGLVPDDIAFLVVLYACSHSGMVERGLNYFHDMSTVYGVMPGAEHYACVIDLLGRAGQLDKAWETIKTMPMKPTAVVWVALLSACRIHANVELAEYSTKKLLEMESENDGSYTLLSNIYANAGRWKDVARIRSIMKNSGIKKRPGCSWVQGKKGTATFSVGDRSHPQSNEIYALLGTLIERIKSIGYVPQMHFALHDVDDEEKSCLLSEHSEKLALAYGILTSSPGTPIRITKNLRVCGDCHSAFVYISKIVEHEIILRDSSRFHHFKKGSCSCGDYW
ncbi:pentatricopeptide repeat-containing protein At5g16860 [Ananas comosus]|uniref:Pentatricopeptide repeat-containing protein At5g16860 n=2 Tax=Ananas comosus TaxID=4615 RepID=A0A6P5GZ60_ANACO|nr:pentatricopeptide repeat-containing protein At5g16860 [Ananas comosus]